jgi:hypothetical protein
MICFQLLKVCNTLLTSLSVEQRAAHVSMHAWAPAFEDGAQ